jgi:hypothetical protein
MEKDIFREACIFFLLFLYFCWCGLINMDAIVFTEEIYTLRKALTSGLWELTRL